MTSPQLACGLLSAPMPSSPRYSTNPAPLASRSPSDGEILVGPRPRMTSYSVSDRPIVLRHQDKLLALQSHGLSCGSRGRSQFQSVSPTAAPMVPSWYHCASLGLMVPLGRERPQDPTYGRRHRADHRCAEGPPPHDHWAAGTSR